MSRGLLALALLSSWLGALPALGQEDVSFRSDVSLVHVDTEILSGDGRIVRGLTAKDFRIFDEGREQKILSMSAEDQPLDLILLFDVSGSMRPNVQKVAAAARSATAQLRKGDRVAIMCFNLGITVSTPFVEDIDAVPAGVEGVLRLPFGGGTAIRAAVNATAKRFIGEEKSGRRRAILVITDDVGMPANEMTVVRNLWEADAVVSALIVSSKGPKPVKNGMVDPIAEKSGGDTVTASDPGAAFIQMIQRIRSRYSLYYATPEGQAGTFHSIRVELGPEARAANPGAKISARRSYQLSR